MTKTRIEPAILKTIKRKMILNELQTNEHLTEFTYYSDDDVELLFNLYSGFDKDRLHGMIIDLDSSVANESISDRTDELKCILTSMMNIRHIAERLIDERLINADYMNIPDYLISNEQDREDTIKWALYGIPNEFIINELWRKLIMESEIDKNDE